MILSANTCSARDAQIFPKHRRTSKAVIIDQMREHKRLCNAILIANKLSPIIILSSLRGNETFTMTTAALIITKIYKIGFQLHKHLHNKKEINIILTFQLLN